MDPKKLLTSIVAVAALGALGGAGVAHAGPTAHRAPDSRLNAQDRTYLGSSPQGDLLEVAGGRIAGHHAAGRDVRAFGHRMVRDHSDEYAAAKRTGKRIGFDVPARPSSGQRQVLGLWRSLHGRALSCAYVSYEWEDHQLDISDAQDEVRAGRNPRVVRDAKESLPVLRQHLNIITRVLHHLDGC